MFTYLKLVVKNVNHSDNKTRLRPCLQGCINKSAYTKRKHRYARQLFFSKNSALLSIQTYSC
jgi:hypothetical protein